MKNLSTSIILFSVCASVSFGAFDYTISSTFHYGTLTLTGEESLLVSGSGASGIHAKDFSYIEIRNTTPYQLNMGGIQTLDLDDNSTLQYYKGETHSFYIYDNAMAIFRGGRIDYISSYQYSGILKHITFVCDMDSIQYNGNLLTGNWLDGSAFSVTLVNQPGYDSVYSNINFVPEPATMLLLGLGGMLIRRKK